MLWLFKAEVGSVGWDRVATNILDGHLATISCATDCIWHDCLRLIIKNTAARPDVSNRESGRVMVLWLGRILVVQVLKMQVELSRLGLVSERRKMRKLGYWTSLRHARGYR